MREAKEFLRALRGKRSQLWFSRRIGFKSNVAAQWEAGRRVPTLVRTLQAASVMGVDVEAGFLKFHRGSALAVGFGKGSTAVDVSTATIAAWLREHKGARTVTNVAELCSLSRTQISRALSGAVELRLTEFFILVDALTHRLPEFIGSFVDIESVPSAKESYERTSSAQALVRKNPWSAAVVTLLDTEAYRQGDEEPAAFLSRRLPVSREDLSRCVESLETAGVLTRRSSKLELGTPLTLELSGSETQRLRKHWGTASAARLNSPGGDDLFSYNLVSLSEADFERVRTLQKDFFRQVRSIAANSQPSECAGLLAWHLVKWDD